MARRKGSSARKGVHSELLLDLGPIKLIRLTLMPGACTPRHHHPCPFIVIPRTSGTLRRIVHGKAKQTERSHKLVAGRPYLRKVGKDGVEHTICNGGDAPIVVEKMIFCPCTPEWEDLFKKIMR